jgi:phage gpG-like protein
MNSKDFMFNLLKDIKTDLADEFDRNFERQAFFDIPWVQRQLKPGGNVLNVHGGAGLRGSIMASFGSDGKIIFTSSLPYASIHNEGGVIVITAQMKKFFWFMYYKASKALSVKANGTARNNKRNQNLNTEATYWKALALKKTGDKLVIPKRQFIGNHPQVKAIVKQNTEAAILRLGEQFKITFKQV